MRRISFRAMTAMLLNAVNQQLPSDWEPLLPIP